ncbi:MAG: Ig-like domain-containing protein, partial [Gammaproteobacteria bacterium]|nr:Ig-like domain-containing protein [Gammaproteobacteria bacterium]
MVNSKRHLFTFLLLIFVITLTACGKGSMSLDVNLDPGDTEQNQKTLTGISISTTESTLTTDSTTALTLIATYDDNTSENITTDVTWSVNEPRFATISNTGLIHTELYVASFSVTAEFQGRTITHTFTSVPAADAVLVNIVLTDNVDLTIPQDIVVVGEYSDGSIAEALAVTIAPTDSQAQVAGVVKFVVSD